jgi:hypothetical protein
VSLIGYQRTCRGSVTDCLLHRPCDLAGSSRPHRTMVLPRYPINLGVPICPMDPEEVRLWPPFALTAAALARRSTTV